MTAAAHLPVALRAAASTTPAAEEFDVVIYGGTPAAVTAAMQVRAMGRSVVIVSPDTHLGGIASSGLGYSDAGVRATIGGFSREFFRRVYAHYQQPEAWRHERSAAYRNRAQGGPAMDHETRTMWVFEPSVAEKIFEDFVREHRLPVHRGQWLDRERGVKKIGSRIVAFTTLAGRTYAGKVFVDATYEGDLMAAAGVPYHVGREANATYGEEHNGVQLGVLHHKHHFGMVPQPISAYRIPGDPRSGLVAGVSAEPPGVFGAGDRRVQAYCFRMCLTQVEENRVPLAPPSGYDPAHYELLARVLAAGWRGSFNLFAPLPNRKTDCNNFGPFSTDHIGANYDYPDASYARRRAIVADHERYQRGLLHFLATDERVPTVVRAEMRTWGLAADEFTDTGQWPRQLYIREARRMIGRHVMTENELRRRRAPVASSVGLGSYAIDSHNVQRHVTPDGHVQNEGDIGVATPGPYGIAYESLTPAAAQCENLLVPVCLSSTHIAYGSIRMEPVFMILGQSAGAAAALAAERNMSVQAVPYVALRDRLLADGQILTVPPGADLPYGVNNHARPEPASSARTP